jgi:hypothetical protein
MVKAFDSIQSDCFNVIQGKHFLHAFDLLDTCFVATLNILARVSFDNL